jgi:hypothetical protein
MKRFNSREAADLLGVCVQRIHAKIKQGHFPGAHYCECGKGYLIPESDILKQPWKKRTSLNAKKSTNSIVSKSNGRRGSRGE